MCGCRATPTEPKTTQKHGGAARTHRQYWSCRLSPRHGIEGAEYLRTERGRSDVNADRLRQFCWERRAKGVASSHRDSGYAGGGGMRHFVLVSVVLVAAFPALGQTPKRSPASASRAWSPPRTPDGNPDLQGAWISNSATPLERPKELAGRALLTEEEVERSRSRRPASSKTTTSIRTCRRRQFLSRRACQSRSFSKSQFHRRYRRHDRAMVRTPDVAHRRPA